MKAMQIYDYGGDEVVRIDKEAPIAAPPAETILVEVLAAGVNPMDWIVREGLAREWLKLQLPAILGLDFSGVVSKVGEGVANFKKGNEVYGQARLSRGGSFAEYTIADTSSIALKPRSLSHIEAASLPLAGISAYQALIEIMNLSRNQKILIHGGAGGIGSIAIQLAKHLGAYIATTVRAKDIGFARALGADLVIDFEKIPFETRVHEFDAVLDTVGGDTYSKSYSVLRVGGVIVSLVKQADSELMKTYGVNAVYEATRVNAERLIKLTEYIDAGVIKPQIDRIFPLEKAARALSYLKEEHPRGKVVIEINEKVIAEARR